MEIPGSGIVNRYIATQGNYRRNHTIFHSFYFIFTTYYFLFNFYTFFFCEGPLSSTVGHFWQMVLEAGTGLIVMLTPLAERGRPKCHQYWPNTEDVLQINELEITCVKEETDDSGSFVFREFLLKDLKVCYLDCFKLGH